MLCDHTATQARSGFACSTTLGRYSAGTAVHGKIGRHRDLSPCACSQVISSESTALRFGQDRAKTMHHRCRLDAPASLTMAYSSYGEAGRGNAWSSTEEPWATLK